MTRGRFAFALEPARDCVYFHICMYGYMLAFLKCRVGIGME